jgi:hypothetical protein
MSYTIEKNIPIKRKTKYPFSAMEVGDSFFVDDPKSQAKLSGAGTAHGRKYGKKFLTAQEGNGIRVWRVA